MQNYSTSAPIVTRPAFVAANPTERAAHRDAQCAMFAACNKFGLGTGPGDRDAMIDGINEAFGFTGSNRLISRRQLTVDEMRALTMAVEAGLFSLDWTWDNDFVISVKSITVAMQRLMLGISPRNRRRF